ncbi:MAG: CDP-alcohol phosphatidyltransferase family protein [Candidatus Competibacter sp.]|nr:CDP-alcohol phosphatidyltransferase family protein [Candidatus Competibacter sp.]MDG4583930.1 CDP-alcohol phosphatidyltransferase family protein [Candidatus Competibacter sp.]
MTDTAKSLFQPLLASTLRSLAPALLSVTGLALLVADGFRLPNDYIVQCLAVLSGLLLALGPFLPQHLPLVTFGAANQVTLSRAGLAALAAGLIGRPEMTPAQSWFVATLAGFALALDGIDGWLARRGGLQSRFGARFDMEVDAFFILILAVLVFQSGKAGAWVLLSGFLRYGFVVLGCVLPWLNRPLPPRKRRQTVCVLQTAVLALCLAPPLLPPWTAALAAAALGLLLVSFAVDVRWLWRTRRSTPRENAR